MHSGMNGGVKKWQLGIVVWFSRFDLRENKPLDGLYWGCVGGFVQR